MVIWHEETCSQTDAKYIKGMIENPDMMPTATINLCIDEILMYQFILRHKAGVTFGPDRLSRRPIHKDDPVFEPCSDDKEEPSGLLLFEVADPMEPQPLPIEEFVDQIDSQKGFFNGIAELIEDFEEELAWADSERAKEKISLQNMLVETDGLMSSGQAKYVRQLVAVLALPPEDGNMENGVYEEEHWGIGMLEQDEFSLT